jgi:signal transduction histidine kinase
MTAGAGDIVVERVRVVAWIRALAATGAAIAACLLPPTTHHRVGLQVVAALVWVPWSAAVALAATGRTPSWLPSLAATGDLGIIFAATLLLPSKAEVATLVYALEVVGAAWAGGLRLSLPVALAAVALPVVAGTVNGDASVDPLLLGVLALVVAAMVAVLERAAVVQRQSEVHSTRLAGKSAAVLDKVADAIVFCDGRGVIVEANAAAARLVHGPVDPAARAACHDVLALHIGERRLDCSNGCPLVGDDGDEGVEAWRPAPDGARQPLLVSVASVGEGDDAEVVHSLRDITRLKQADEAKTLFLATASHELKTPLTVIAGFSETLLLHGALDERDREYALRAIDTRAHELSRIVDRLLLSSRIEAGRVDIEMSVVRIVPLVLERAAALERATDRPVHLSVDVADDIVVAADPGAFVTVVDHLLDNAVKYSPDGGPVRVDVRGARPAGDERDDRVEVSVTDEGIGMDADAVDHCFDKFWQSQVGDRRRFGGTGIGLYIVKSLVEAMHGAVRVESALGRGATFTVELRVADEGVWDLEPASITSTGGERSMVREFMRQIGVSGGD